MGHNSVKVSIWRVFAVVGVFTRSISAYQQCYYPDGSIPTDYIYLACGTQGNSSCCADGDICQENGLCYYPGNGLVYRGACTDRTWNDASCRGDTCMTGEELTTWDWALECDSGGSSSIVCGAVSGYLHETPTCSNGAVSNTASYQTTTSTTSVGRYTPPPSIDTAVYSVWTSSYTVTLTADQVSTILTTTFQSTFTSTIDHAAATSNSESGSGSSSSSGASSSETSGSGSHVVLPTGALIGIIVGAVVIAIAVSIVVFLVLRKRSQKKQEAIRLNSASYPPPNGPVGADQVHPYEVDVNEVTTLPQKHLYTSPKVGVAEMGMGGAGEKKWDGPHNMTAEEHDELRSPLRSPAPAYAEALMPVELDGTSSVRSGR